jgi:hypothetical protein
MEVRIWVESAKRGRDDNEAGPSNDCSNDQQKCPKMSRMESQSQEWIIFDNKGTTNSSLNE